MRSAGGRWLARTLPLAAPEAGEQLEIIGAAHGGAELGRREHPPHPLEARFHVHARGSKACQEAAAARAAAQGELFDLNRAGGTMPARSIQPAPSSAGRFAVPAPRRPVAPDAAGRPSPLIYNVKAGGPHTPPADATTPGGNVINWAERAPRIAARRRREPRAGAQ